MSDYYADSSVLVKRHIAEQGSRWFHAVSDADAGNSIITAQISIVEVVSAFNRRIREGSLSLESYTRIRADFGALHSNQYRLVNLTPLVLQRAQTLLEHHPLRAYDAIQLASGLIADSALQSGGVPPLTFLSSDRRLLDAAQAEGLTVHHPTDS